MVVDLQIENQIEQVPTPPKNLANTKRHVHPPVLLAFHKMPKVHGRSIVVSLEQISALLPLIAWRWSAGPRSPRSAAGVEVSIAHDGNVDIRYVLLVNTLNCDALIFFEELLGLLPL